MLTSIIITIYINEKDENKACQSLDLINFNHLNLMQKLGWSDTETLEIDENNISPEKKIEEGTAYGKYANIKIQSNWIRPI